MNKTRPSSKKTKSAGVAHVHSDGMMAFLGELDDLFEQIRNAQRRAQPEDAQRLKAFYVDLVEKLLITQVEACCGRPAARKLEETSQAIESKKNAGSVDDHYAKAFGLSREQIHLRFDPFVRAAVMHQNSKGTR